MHHHLATLLRKVPKVFFIRPLFHLFREAVIVHGVRPRRMFLSLRRVRRQKRPFPVVSSPKRRPTIRRGRLESERLPIHAPLLRDDRHRDDRRDDRPCDHSRPHRRSRSRAVPNAVAIERAFANTVVSRRVDVSEKRVALRARDDHGDATRESLDTRPSSDARRCVARRCVARRRARDRIDRVDDDSFVTVWFIK